MKKYYLIKEWNECRGSTEENPTCYFKGTGLVHIELPSHLWNYQCYTSVKAAERYADKLRMFSRWGSKYKVVDITNMVKVREYKEGE